MTGCCFIDGTRRKQDGHTCVGDCSGPKNCIADGSRICMILTSLLGGWLVRVVVRNVGWLISDCLWVCVWL